MIPMQGKQSRKKGETIEVNTSSSLGYTLSFSVPAEWSEALDYFKRYRYFFETHNPDKAVIEPLRRSWRLETNRRPLFEGANNIHIPVLRWMVDALATRLFAAHFSQTPYVLLRPFNTNLINRITDLEELLFLYQRLSQRSRYFYPIILDAVLLGTGVGFKSWKREQGKSYPLTEYVPLENLIAYPAVRRFEDLMVIGHKEAYTIKRLSEEFDLPEDLYRRIGIGAMMKELKPDPEMTAETGWGIVQVNRLYFWYNGDWFEAVYLPMYGHILHFAKYPFPILPYVLYTITPRIGIFGEGIGRLVEGLERSVVELHNLQLDNLMLTNIPVFKVRKGSSASNITKFSAGMKIPVETPSDIDILVMPQQYGGLVQEQQQLQDLAKMISGVSEIMQGQPPSPYATAYAVEATLLEGSVKFKQHFQLGKEALIRDAILDLLFIKRYGDPLFETTALGKPTPMAFFTEDDIIQQTQFQIEPNTTQINRETDRQRWLAIRELFYPTLPPSGKWEIDAHILKLMGVSKPEVILGEKPSDAVPPTPPPAPVSPPPTATGGEVGV